MKSIMTQIEDIQRENAELKKYKKAVQKYLQKSTDFLEKKETQKEPEKTPETADKKALAFAQKITAYYDLKTDAEMDAWMEIMLNERSLHFWNRCRENRGQA